MIPKPRALEFSGGAVVRFRRFHYGGLGLIPGLIPYSKPHCTAKTKQNKKSKKTKELDIGVVCTLMLDPV